MSSPPVQSQIGIIIERLPGLLSFPDNPKHNAEYQPDRDRNKQRPKHAASLLQGSLKLFVEQGPLHLELQVLHVERLDHIIISPVLDSINGSLKGRIACDQKESYLV